MITTITLHNGIKIKGIDPEVTKIMLALVAVDLLNVGNEWDKIRIERLDTHNIEETTRATAAKLVANGQAIITKSQTNTPEGSAA